MLGLVRPELVLGLHLVVQQPSLQQLHHQVERVVRLEHFEQPHAVLVLQTAHDLDLLQQALLALVLTVGCLLREGLHREVPARLQLLGQVDRREVALAYLLLGLELLVEAALVEPAAQDVPPCG